jgi:hypothetical protein
VGSLPLSLPWLTGCLLPRWSGLSGSSLSLPPSPPPLPPPPPRLTALPAAVKPRKGSPWGGSAWRARPLDGVIIASFPHCGYATGLCLSGHNGREGWIGLSFVVGKNGDRSCQRLQLCFVLFVLFCRDLHIDVFRTSLLAFASWFAEAIAGSFFVVGFGVVLVE